jgi:diguanylate cyclase (GGDEF)-like protein
MRWVQAFRAVGVEPLASVVRGGREIASNVPAALRIPVVIGLLLLAGLFAGVPGTAWAAHGDWLYNGLEFAAPVLCAIRAIRQPRERAVWILFALGTTSYALGNVYWGLVLEDEASPPYPSPADGFWLGLYPCMFSAMWLLARARLRGVNRRIWLDGLIVGLGLAALSASVVFRAVAHTTDGDAMTIVTNLSYPAADLLSLIFIAVLFSGARTLVDRTCQTLAAGIGVFLVTDSIYLVQIADGTYALNGMLDLGWPLAVVLIGVAAWQPAGSRGIARAESSITVPAVLVSLCVALMVYDHFIRVETLGVILAAATLAAAVCRLVLTYRASSQLIRTTHKAATTDELTQLGNRAKLLRDLDDALDSDKRTLLAFFDLDGFKNYNDSYGHPAGDALLHRLARGLALAMPAGGEAYRLGGDEFCALIPWLGTTDVTDVVAPACAALFEQGEGFSVTTSWGHVIVPTEASTTSQALSIADHRLYADKSDGRMSARRESQQVLKRVLEQRDHTLGIHIDEVAVLAERTALDLGLGETEIEQVVLAAELHDIGKSAIPDAILFKNGPLNADESAFMRRHTVIGERIIAGAPSLTPIARIVRSSHEHFDGTGYPDGLAGDEIPLAARIVFVCDAFEAMTSDRSYRIPVTAGPALAELRACAGSQFDPAVVEAFARAQARAPMLRAAI